ncbi:hypothetical protein CNR22_06810 [Sphingobacteriaceae bacterium]|nr:hypothetical protein CNR22_06810 [Sphingobacteriaceae bacterium]
MDVEINFPLSAERHLENTIDYYQQINIPLARRFYKEFYGLIALLKSILLPKNSMNLELAN